VADVTICMIDDDEHDVFLARRIFSRHAPRVRVVHQADAGAIYDDVDPLASLHPDFIFLDINMPKTNGLDLLRRLKSERATCAIPVIVFTTSDMQEHVDTAYARGAAAYLVKPHSVDDYARLARAFAQFWIETARRPGQA
jgi:DNA-binding NarL/FixJ family response regulator